MKLTIEKGESNDKMFGSAGLYDKLFIDGQPIEGVTDYKIERSAAGLGFNITIKMKADVEITENKHLSDIEKAKKIKEFQELIKRVFI